MKAHLALIKTAEQTVEHVIVSIFDNLRPSNNSANADKYPRTLQEDCEKLKSFKVDIIFSPFLSTNYPNCQTKQTYVEVPELTNILEGANRPGHFRHVTTLTSKFFNLIQPDITLFGEKDFQQLQVIRQMMSDLAFDITIISVPTMRDQNGLALSTRNTLLTHEQQQITPKLYQVMTSISKQLVTGERNIEAILNIGKQQLHEAGFTP